MGPADEVDFEAHAGQLSHAGGRDAGGPARELRGGGAPDRRPGGIVGFPGRLPSSAAAPWFPPGARWSARRVLLHIIAETAQHAGHADIIRESLDGAKTMG